MAVMAGQCTRVFLVWIFFSSRLGTLLMIHSCLEENELRAPSQSVIGLVFHQQHEDNGDGFIKDQTSIPSSNASSEYHVFDGSDSDSSGNDR
jgi:hypothetical protein